MTNDISAYSAEKLLHILKDKSARESELRHEADIRLFKKWRDGDDLGPLFELLASESASERLQGAFYLVEFVPRDEGIANLTARLADDPLPYCRKAFVGYMTNTGLYDEAIATGLAKCLLDFDPYVRLEAMNWTVYTTDDRFDNFSRVVTEMCQSQDRDSWGEPERKRASSVLGIAGSLRKGESVENIRRSIPDEDDFTFDYLQLFEKRLNRYVERRKIRTNATNIPIGYDEFEIGANGEIYDNLGMLKGDLPVSVGPDVTDAQLNDMIDRAKESTRQRKLDQSALDQSRAKRCAPA
jgi:hypothetical protein